MANAQLTEAVALILAADIIAPYIDGTFYRRQRAESVAYELHSAGLLYGGRVWPGTGTVQERVTYTLQCRMDWSKAETIAAKLAEAGLLRPDTDHG